MQRVVRIDEDFITKHIILSEMIFLKIKLAHPYKTSQDVNSFLVVLRVLLPTQAKIN